MNRVIRAPRVRTCAALLAVAVGGCVDLSPLEYVPPEGGVSDAAPADAGGADARVASCETCFETTPTCEPSWTACQADPICTKFANCMSTSACWSQNLGDLANPSPCLVTCALTAGIVSQNSPSAALVSPLYTCAQDPTRCKSACTGTGDR
jgi:hypothetical protein